MADLGGGNALSGAAGAGINESLQKQLKEKYKDNPDAWQWVSAIIGGAAGQLAGGDAQTGASTAASGTKNNSQAERKMAASTAKTKETTDAINQQISGTEEVEPGMAEEETKTTPNEEVENGHQDEQTKEMTEQPQEKKPGEIEGNITKEGGKYYKNIGGEKIEIDAEKVEGKQRYYVEGQGWYENINGTDTYVPQDRIENGKQWTVDEQGRDKYVGEVNEAYFNEKSPEKQEILLKLNSAESIADQVEYFGQYFGQDWKERIEGYWDNQYELYVQAGTTPELAKVGADLATGELMTPVIGSLSKGNAIASDMGVLEGKLNNASKGNVGGKVVEGSGKAEITATQETTHIVGKNPVVGEARQFWTETTAFKGTKVYQRNDLIDPNMVDNLGRTNLQRMEQGLAPLGADGKSINLHHMTQTNESAIAEVTQSFHQENSSVIHINPNTIPSGINRNEFDAWRKAYWKNRANDFK